MGAEVIAPAAVDAVGYRHFDRVLSAAVLLCWTGIVVPPLLTGTAIGPQPLVWIALVAFAVGFLLMRPALRAPRAGPGRHGVVVMTVSGIAASIPSTRESLAPVLLVVTCATAGFALSRYASWVVLALNIATLLGCMIAGIIQVQWAVVFSAMAVFAGMVVEVTVREFYGRQRLAQTSRELELANATLEQAQLQLAEQTRTAERLRISRDLHDTVGHRLTALSLKLELAAQLADGADGADSDVAQRVHECRALVGSTLTDVRDAVNRLRDTRGFAERVEALAALPGLGSVTITVDPQVEQCPDQVREAAYRVVQESVTNVARHAQATMVQIVAVLDEGELLVRVRDDGVGFAEHRAGNGMRGMRERVESLGGVVRWEQHPNGGVSVAARIPMSEDSEA